MDLNSLDMSDMALEASKKTTVYANGRFRAGAGVTVYTSAASGSLSAFLTAAGERLGMRASRLFTDAGVEVDDLALVDDGDTLFVSAGEDFRDPQAAQEAALAARRKRLQRRKRRQQQQDAQQAGGSGAGAAASDQKRPSGDAGRGKTDALSPSGGGGGGGGGATTGGTKVASRGSSETDSDSDVGAGGSSGRGMRVGGYRLVEYLGRGAYGRVYKAVNELHGDLVAMKFISKQEMQDVHDAERIATEIHCLETLQHVNVIKLYKVLNTDDAVVLVFEYAGGGDLRQAVRAAGRLGEREAARIFDGLVDGLTYCHMRHIVHHDLKLENVLLSHPAPTAASGRGSTSSPRTTSAAGGAGGGAGVSLGAHDSLPIAKIADFGLSAMYRPGSTSTSTAGSLAYIAPEVLKEGSVAGPPRDAWSLGVILFAMLVGRLPFESTSDKKLRRAISTGYFKYDSADKPSKDARDLIESLLTVDPDVRATLPSVKTHPWILRHMHSRNIIAAAVTSSPLGGLGMGLGRGGGGGIPALAPRSDAARRRRGRATLVHRDSSGSGSGPAGGAAAGGGAAGASGGKVDSSDRLPQQQGRGAASGALEGGLGPTINSGAASNGSNHAISPQASGSGRPRLGTGAGAAAPIEAAEFGTTASYARSLGRMLAAGGSPRSVGSAGSNGLATWGGDNGVEGGRRSRPLVSPTPTTTPTARDSRHRGSPTSSATSNSNQLQAPALAGSNSRTLNAKAGSGDAAAASSGSGRRLLRHAATPTRRYRGADGSDRGLWTGSGSPGSPHASSPTSRSRRRRTLGSHDVGGTLDEGDRTARLEARRRQVGSAGMARTTTAAGRTGGQARARHTTAGTETSEEVWSARRIGGDSDSESATAATMALESDITRRRHLAGGTSGTWAAPDEDVDANAARSGTRSRGAAALEGGLRRGSNGVSSVGRRVTRGSSYRRLRRNGDWVSASGSGSAGGGATVNASASAGAGAGGGEGSAAPPWGMARSASDMGARRPATSSAIGSGGLHHYPLRSGGVGLRGRSGSTLSSVSRGSLASYGSSGMSDDADSMDGDGGQDETLSGSLAPPSARGSARRRRHKRLGLRISTHGHDDLRVPATFERTNRSLPTPLASPITSPASPLNYTARSLSGPNSPVNADVTPRRRVGNGSSATTTTATTASTGPRHLQRRGTNSSVSSTGSAGGSTSSRAVDSVNSARRGSDRWRVYSFASMNSDASSGASSDQEGAAPSEGKNDSPHTRAVDAHSHAAGAAHGMRAQTALPGSRTRVRRRPTGRKPTAAKPAERNAPTATASAVDGVAADHGTGGAAAAAGGGGSNPNPRRRRRGSGTSVTNSPMRVPIPVATPPTRSQSVLTASNGGTSAASTALPTSSPLKLPPPASSSGIAGGIAGGSAAQHASLAASRPQRGRGGGSGGGGGVGIGVGMHHMSATARTVARSRALVARRRWRRAMLAVRCAVRFTYILRALRTTTRNGITRSPVSAAGKQGDSKPASAAARRAVAEAQEAAAAVASAGTAESLTAPPASPTTEAAEAAAAAVSSTLHHLRDSTALSSPDASRALALRRWRVAKVLVTAVVRFGRGNVYNQSTRSNDASGDSPRPYAAAPASSNASSTAATAGGRSRGQRSKGSGRRKGGSSSGSSGGVSSGKGSRRRRASTSHGRKSKRTGGGSGGSRRRKSRTGSKPGRSRSSGGGAGRGVGKVDGSGMEVAGTAMTSAEAHVAESLVHADEEESPVPVPAPAPAPVNAPAEPGPGLVASVDSEVATTGVLGHSPIAQQEQSGGASEAVASLVDDADTLTAAAEAEAEAVAESTSAAGDTEAEGKVEGKEQEAPSTPSPVLSPASSHRSGGSSTRLRLSSPDVLRTDSSRVVVRSQSLDFTAMNSAGDDDDDDDDGGDDDVGVDDDGH